MVAWLWYLCRSCDSILVLLRLCSHSSGGNIREPAFKWNLFHMAEAGRGIDAGVHSPGMKCAVCISVVVATVLLTRGW